MSKTMSADAVAEALGVSTWAIYESVKEGICPVEPIRVGRRLLWSTAKVAALLGIDEGGLEPPDAQSGRDRNDPGQRNRVNGKSTPPASNKRRPPAVTRSLR